MNFEIWIGEHYSHFDHGLVHMDDGRSLPLKGWIHIATYGADSILIADKSRYEMCDFPVRWFIYPSGIEFYCWDTEVKSITLHNCTGTDVLVRGYGVLPAGETREYFEEQPPWWECPLCGMKYRTKVTDTLDACTNCGFELEKKQKIHRNRVRCRKCGSTIESKSAHDFQTCACGAVSIDGGLEYLRRVGYPENIEELSEYEEI